MKRTLLFISFIAILFPSQAQVGLRWADLTAHLSAPPLEIRERKALLALNDTSKVAYKANLVFQFGGESKLTLLPKINLLRVHQRHLIKPYYGLELGVHPLFVAGAFTFSGILGFEVGQFNLESSFSHFRTTKIRDGYGNLNGPYYQNLLNLKLGYSIRRFTIKLGTSFIINDTAPTGDDRLPLLDIGKINQQIFGLELQYRIN